MTDNEPKLRPDEMYEYQVAFQSGYSGEEDFEPDSHATLRGYRDGCACREGEQKRDRGGSKTPSDYAREAGFIIRDAAGGFSQASN